MKTVMIYDQLDANPTFFVLDGDYSHLNHVYINMCIDGPKAEQKKMDKLQDELTKLVYDPKTGVTLLAAYKEFPTQAVLDGAVVIVAGFLP